MPTTHRDFRTLDAETQAEIRRLALSDSDHGDHVRTVAVRYGVHYQTIYDWRRDRDALKARNYHGLQRGRLKDVQKCIQPSVEVIIKNLIKDTTPDTHQIAASLWDRRAIQALIVQHIGKTIPLQRVSVYTKRWGFTPPTTHTVSYRTRCDQGTDMA